MGGTSITSVSVSGSAALSGGTIILSGVVFTISFSGGMAVDNLQFDVFQSDQKSAPYIKGSAAVASTPPGWKAGHTYAGLYALYKGRLGGSSVSNAALSAEYADKGPQGTLVAFRPGEIWFETLVPVQASVSCHPTNRVIPNIASVTE